MSLSIPDRWLKYTPYGEPIKGTKLLPLKVPLKEAISRHVQPEKRFTPAMLVEAFPNLKYIVDLTSTYRYYDRSEFSEAGVRYEKVKIPGQTVPDLNHVKRFFQVMDDFMATSAEGDLIGIHCTHGVNRTGYLICRYLIQQLGWEIGKAIKAFHEARGHAIEREAYVTALKKVPRGEKMDASRMNVPAWRSQLPSSPSPSPSPSPSMRPAFRVEANKGYPGSSPALAGKRVPFEMGARPMGPPSIRLLVPPRRVFEGPFSPQQFSFGGPRPGFGPMPPPAGIPPITPPHPPPPLPPLPPLQPPLRAPPLARRAHTFGSRGSWFVPQLRPPMPSPFPKTSFPTENLPPRLSSVINEPANIGRLPITRLPRQQTLPSPSQPPPSKVHVYNCIRGTKRKADTSNSDLSDEDFTADTFEENLLEGPSSRSSNNKGYKSRLGKRANGPDMGMHPSRPNGTPMKRR